MSDQEVFFALEKGSTGQQRGPRLTNRDGIALRWIAQRSAIRFDQLQRLLAQCSTNTDRIALPGILGEHSTRRILRRWLMEGLVIYKIFHVREKGWIWLSEKGLLYVGLECAAYQEPQPHTFEQIFLRNEALLLQSE